MHLFPLPSCLLHVKVLTLDNTVDTVKNHAQVAQHWRSCEGTVGVTCMTQALCISRLQGCPDQCNALLLCGMHVL